VVDFLPQPLTLGATFAAGLASFLAPCTLPLVPAYLGYASGLAGHDINQPGSRERLRVRLLAGTVLFVLGFGIVFVLLGTAAGGIGQAVRSVGPAVQLAGGILMVVLGLALAGLLRVPGLERTLQMVPPARLRSLGLWAALPFGAVFGIGWTPCVGPFLGSALALAALTGQAATGAILLAGYALGLGLPFVVVALAWASFPGLTRGLGRFGAASSRFGGLAIAGLGLAVATGFYSHVTSLLAQISL